MPPTRASRRSAAAKKRMADRCGVAAALTDGVSSPHYQKALTDEVLSPRKKKAKLGPSHAIIAFKNSAQKACENSAQKACKNSSTEPCTNSGINPVINPEYSINHPISASFPQQSTVRGSFHQGYSQFGNNANKQCVANSVIAIMMSQVKNVLTWTTTDLDDVLLNGDTFYSIIRDANLIRDASGYLFVADLPTEHTLHGHTFYLNYSDNMFVGMFGVNEYGEMQNVYMSHDKAIIKVMSQFDACLFTVEVNTCAIIKQGSWYVLIDSHARSTTGEMDAQSVKYI